MERRAIAVQGVVQGVGFRPFVYSLASRLQLRGFVKNRTGGVWIEIEGEAPSLDSFLDELITRPPPLARIDHFSWESRHLEGDCGFRIEHSEAGTFGSVFVSPDVATCNDCLAELFDPANRRYHYPFLNCTNCGPRLTIVTGSPYDRERTTMASFAICSACRKEYEDPTNRRFHAQPTACPACGPRLQILDEKLQRINIDDPLSYFASAIRNGKIGALKGLGGYHLVCDASSEAAVSELRRRKHRDEKPFAVMTRDIIAAEALCNIASAEKDLLLSANRPIVLLRKRPATGIAEGVAPRNPYLGIMLPYTPLHHLLMQAAEGLPLVMTSGNRSDEPIVYCEDDLNQLTDIADLFLIHDRPINVRCDDSVMHVIDRIEQPLRRSRGYAPQPIKLPFDCPKPILATGGQLKVTFAVGRDRQAFLSHHLGDLDHYEAYRAFKKDVALFEQLFAIEPMCLAHDLHPDYVTSRYARERSAQKGIALLTVQHHHAHMASCMAEHGLNESVIGVTFDGTGLGTDGAVWGGEFLVGDYSSFRRMAHLRYVGLPGGEQAIREPWRMAVAHLTDARVKSAALEARNLPNKLKLIEKMLASGFNTPRTSSVGRLFDAIASLTGLRDCVSYEGQAAVELEWRASGVSFSGSYPFELYMPNEEAHVEPIIVDTRPLIRAVVEEVARGVDAAIIARRFHSTLVDLIAAVCDRIRQATGLGAVVLSGGVFLNALLTRETTVRLNCDGFRVYQHRLVPPGDGGLSLGQLAVAAARLC